MSSVVWEFIFAFIGLMWLGVKKSFGLWIITPTTCKGFLRTPLDSGDVA